MTERVYLDWNATAPLRAEAQRALQDAAGLVGNPSSVHAEGRAARRLIEQAREEVAALVGAQPADVIFTSSGTEANMLALTPAIETAGEKRPRDRLLISAIEHPSVRAGGRFPREAIEDIPVEATDAYPGRVNLAALAEALTPAKTSRPLVSLMLANNETGVVQPVAEAADNRACGGRPSACRCRAGRGAHPLRYPRARRRSVDAVGPQDRRRQGRRRPGARGRAHSFRRSADPRRRSGAGASRRHGKCRRDRRLRRGRRGGAPPAGGRGRAHAGVADAPGGGPAQPSRRRR